MISMNMMSQTINNRKSESKINPEGREEEGQKKLVVKLGWNESLTNKNQIHQLR